MADCSVAGVFEWLALMAAEPERARETSRAIILFLVIAGGLAVFLFVVALLAVLNRRHAPQEKSPPREEPADPWLAAGERAEPLDTAPRSDRDD